MASNFCTIPQTDGGAGSANLNPVPLPMQRIPNLNRAIGGVDRVDGFFADVDGARRFLHREAQSLAPEELHPDRPQSFTQGGL